jgi:ketosteroid isomerase-like protein
MTQDNVEFVRGLYTAAGAMSKDELLAALPAMVPQMCDPEIEWVEDPDRADGRTYRGHDGVVESFQNWLEQFERYEMDLKEVRDLGDRVFATAQEVGRGEVSGAEVVAEIHQVMTFRNGKLLRYEEFYDRSAALRAAGLGD